MNCMRTYIKNLQAGEAFREVFLLKRKDLGKTKNDKPYLRLAFGDKTGSIEARMWENAEVVDQKVDAGAAVYVTGVVDEWNSTLQLRVESMNYADAGTYKYEDLLKCAENIDEMFESVKSFLRKNISSNWVSLLVQEFLSDEEFVIGFKRSPGARSWHNAYVGGLMEHTFEVMTVVEKMCELYPEANRDVMLFGAFIHDMGKMYELDPFTFEYTAQGGLIGHLPLGFEALSEKIRNIKDFPENMAMQLKHIILSAPRRI